MPGTADNDAALTALRERFGVDASMAEGAVTFHVEAGEAFVPRLFAELGVANHIGLGLAADAGRRVHAHTGTTIRDAEAAGATNRNQAPLRTLAGAGR